MSQLPFTPLPTEFSRNGFNYVQVKRSEKAAMYKQCTKEEIATTVAYEVFAVRTAKAKEAFGKQYGPSELLPSNEAFGYWAWTFSTMSGSKEQDAIERASAKFNDLDKDRAQVEDAPETDNEEESDESTETES